VTDTNETITQADSLREFCDLLDSELAHLNQMAVEELEINQRFAQWQGILDSAIKQLEFVRGPISGTIKCYGEGQWCAFLGNKPVGNFPTEEQARINLRMAEDERRKQRTAALERRTEAIMEEFDFDALRVSLARVQETYQGRMEVIQRLLDHSIMKEEE